MLRFSALHICNNDILTHTKVVSLIHAMLKFGYPEVDQLEVISVALYNNAKDVPLYNEYRRVFRKSSSERQYAERHMGHLARDLACIATLWHIKNHAENESYVDIIHDICTKISSEIESLRESYAINNPYDKCKNDTQYIREISDNISRNLKLLLNNAHGNDPNPDASVNIASKIIEDGVAIYFIRNYKPEYIHGQPSA